MKYRHTTKTTTSAAEALLHQLYARNSVKPDSVQGRIVRRIVEKRRAQTAHRQRRQKAEWQEALRRA